MPARVGSVLVTAPSVEPLLRDPDGGAKNHLRVDHTADDDLIDSLITAARQWVEDHTGRPLITQTWRMTLDCFPAVICLDRVPVQSVTSITYVDTDGVTQTLATDQYRVETDYEPAVIEPAYDVLVWPTIREVAGAVKVTYVAGYGDSGDDVPGPILAAMRLMIGNMYENREEAVDGFWKNLPFGVESLLAPYVRHAYR